MKLFLLVSLGGALGALSRWLISSRIDVAINSDKLPVAPAGTLVVNSLGSLLIGIVFGIALARGALSDPIRSFVVIGFLGSFTTFSTFSYHTFELLRAGYTAHAFGNIVLNIVITIGFVAAGFLMGQKLGQPA